MAAFVRGAYNLVHEKRLIYLKKKKGTKSQCRNPAYSTDECQFVYLLKL